MAAAVVVAFVFETFVGVVGTFDDGSAFAALETAADALSFFSSANENNSKS